MVQTFSQSNTTPLDREIAPAPPSTPTQAVVESPRTKGFDRDSEPSSGPSRISTYSLTCEQPLDGEPPHPSTMKATKKRNKRSHPITLLKRLQPMLVLENSGSVARDHLASERTFLAYVRTSLAITSTGVALVQLFTIAVNTANSSEASKRLQSFARPLGAATVVFGVMVLLIGTMRYFTIQTALTKGVFPVTRMVMMAITSVLGILIAIVFGVLIAEQGPTHGGD